MGNAEIDGALSRGRRLRSPRYFVSNYRVTKTAFSTAVASFVAGALLILSGCGKPHTPINPNGHALPEPPAVSGSAPGNRGGQLVLSISASPVTFNPVQVIDQASDGVVRMLFSSLVVMDLAAQEPRPGLAESWSVEPDQRTWTFKLRNHLRWSDGTPLTADDVEFTWNSVMYDRNLNRLTFDMFHLNGQKFAVSAIDPVTVRVVAPAVFAPFLEFFGTVTILPKHLFAGPVSDGRFPESYLSNAPPERIVGSGPFRVKEIIPGKSIVLERNPEYWKVDSKGQRLPYLDTVKLVIATNPATATSLFLKGQIDALETIRAADYDQYAPEAANGGFRLEQTASTQNDCFWVNQNTGVDAFGRPLVNPAKLKWFRDKRFREALSCAINRERIVREVYHGHADLIYGLVSPRDTKWFNPAAAPYVYDPERARALLASMGIRSPTGVGTATDAAGNDVEMTLYSNFDNPAREKAAHLIQEDLARAGIKLNIEMIDFRALVRKVNETLDYECALMGLGGGGTDPASQINVLKSSEALHQWFPAQKSPSTDWEARLDALTDAGIQTLDLGARKKTYDEVQAIWAEQVPMVCLASPFAYAAIRTNISNIQPSSISAYRVTWNIDELYANPAKTTAAEGGK